MSEMLVIVESPAKAKTIGKFLGSKYKVIASNGHVRDLPKSQLGVDVEHDFQPKYITLRGRGEVLEKIRREAKNAKKVYLATDPDMEGEAISWHLSQILKLDADAKCRIVFNEITSNTIKKSIKAARTIDMNLVDAQQARRVLDRLVGYKLSPILWAKVRKGLSAGRVQSVAVRLICDREQEIIDFVPEEYWHITASLKIPGTRKPVEARFYGLDGKKTPVSNEAQALEIVERSKDANFVISDIKVAERTRHAAPPFTTSSLQQDASRKLGFTTRLTMLLAQQLYEGVELSGGTTGLITYIRTDSVRIANEAIDSVREVIGETYGENYLPEKPNVYRGRKGAQDAHEAIRPTNASLTPAQVKDALNANQYKLYKLIYERFIASQMAPARYETSTVTFDANGCTYRANGSRTLFDGFTVIYSESHDDEEDKVTLLPQLSVGEHFTAQKVLPEQKFTQAPPRYTEATLVKLMEENGIGRPSTYAPTISTILERGYIQREKKQLVPTELGFVVTKLMQENFDDIVDVKFTAELEEKLDCIREGEQEWTSVIRDFYGPFIQTINTASESIERIVIPDEVSDIECDKCGAMMVYKQGRFGKFLACPNFPECRNTKTIMEKIGVPCPKCGSELLKRRSRRGRAFYGCERYPECDFVSWDRPTNEKCPQCGKLMVQKVGQNGGYTICPDKACGYVSRPVKRGSEE